MQEDIKIYEQMVKMRKFHSKFVSNFGPFGEQRISTATYEQDDYYRENGFPEDDYNERI